MAFEENILTVTDEMGNPKKKSTWENKTHLPNAQDSAEDIKFSPRDKGLVLGTVNADGKLYIYDLENFSMYKQLAAV